MNKKWGKIVSLLLCVSMLFSLLPSLAFGQETVTTVVKPSGDAVIDKAKPDTNFPTNTDGSSTAGQWNLKRGSGNPPSTLRIGVFQFPVETEDEIAGAELRFRAKMNANQTKDVSFSVVGVTYDAWQDTTITWNNSPHVDPVSGEVIDSGATVLGQLNMTTTDTDEKDYLFNVTDFVKEHGQDKKVTFLLVETTGSNQNISIFSSDNSNTSKHPELRITTVQTSPPAKPGNVKVTPGDQQLKLDWDAAPGAQYYQLEFATAAEGPYQVVPDNITSPTYTHTGLTNGQTYFYTIKAVNSNGAGEGTDPVNGVPALPAEQPEKLDIIEVTASGHDGNFPENTLDDDLGTRWSAQSAGTVYPDRSPQWIQYDLGAKKQVGYLGIAFASGDKRFMYFDIDLSEDGTNYTNVFKGQSSGTTLGLEPFDFEDIDARYVRITGYGNSVNGWNSLTVVHIYPPNPNGPIMADLNPPPPEVPGDLTPYQVAGLFDNQGNPHPVHTPNAVTGAVIDVTAYGAIPDDNQDDNAAILAAFSAAQAGDEVYFPNGIYDLITTLPNDGTSHISLKSGVNVRGESQAGVQLRSHLDRSTANGKVMNAFGQHDIKISDLTITSTFDGPYSTNHNVNNPDRGGPESGIYIEDRINQPSYNITIDSVTIEKFQKYGVRISKSRDVVVRNSVFQNMTDVGGGGAGYGITIQGIPKVNRLGYANDSKHNLIENNRFLGPYMRHGIIIQNYTHNNEVRNNYFEKSVLDAIDLHGEDEYLNKIWENEITGTLTGAGIALGNTGGTAPSNHDASGPFNHIYRNTISNSREGIKVHMGSPDTLIEENTIHNTIEPNSSKGIFIQNAPRTIIKNNTITNNTASNFWGITLEYDNGDPGAGGVAKGNPENIQIIGNTITGNSNGVKIDAGTYTMTGNTVEGNLGVNFVDNSTNNPPPVENPDPFPVPAPVVSGNTVTITASADSMVRDGSAYSGDNYGADTKMKIKEREKDDTGFERRVFLKFDLSALAGVKVESAKLMLYNDKLESGNPQGYHVTAQGVADDSWTEFGITYTNQPQVVEDLETVKVTQDASYVEYDVTSFVEKQADGVASFRMVGVEDNLGADYASRENTDLNKPPLLVVTVNRSVTVVASEDTYVTEQTPNGNFGSGNLKVKKNVSSGITSYRDAFFKFDLSDLNGEVEEAIFKVYATSLDSNTVAEGYEVEVLGMTDDSWRELEVTYNNQPADQGVRLGDPFRILGTMQNSYLSFDVTDFVQSQSDGVVSLRFRGVTDSRGGNFTSKESSAEDKKPVLVLKVAPPSVEDNTPPSMPGGLSATVASSQRIDLSWEASTDDIGVVKYVVTRNGVEIGTTVAAAYSDTGLTGGTTYTYQVVAVDAANNASAPAQVTATTLGAELQGIRIVGAGPLVVGGAERQVQAFGLYSDQTEAPVGAGVQYASSDTAVVTVSTEGILRAIATGTAEIQASFGGFTAKVEVHVYVNYYEAAATDDTYVRSGLAAQGSEPTMNIKSNTSGSDTRRAYLKFDLPSGGQGILDQAVVRVFVTALETSTPDEGYQVKIYGLDDDTWTEQVLVHSAQPVAADTAEGLTTVQVNKAAAGTYIEFDVTPFVKKQTDGKVSFFIQSAGPASRGAHYATKENDLNKPPMLVMTYKAEKAPAIPQNVAAKAGDGQVTLTWDEADMASTYIVKRSESVSGPFVKVTELMETRYVDNGLKNGVTYYYIVLAANGLGESADSAVVSAKPFHPLEMSVPRFTDLTGKTVVSLNGTGFLRTSVELVNASEAEQSGTFIVALYNGQTMESVAFVDKVVGVGKTVTLETGFNVPADPTGYYVKVFVWDSFKGMVPVSQSITFP
jgi:hypothetical protein